MPLKSYNPIEVNVIATMSEKTQNLEDIILDIEDEKCVLLIGPEVLAYENKPHIQYVHDQILVNENDSITYYYSKDKLFLFNSVAGKVRSSRRMKRIYHNMPIPVENYKKILQLPVSLIISLNPDTFLSDSASSLGLPHDFKHFRFNGEVIDDVVTPKIQHPVIYNLFGSIKEEESLILDYEDLFNLLRVVLPDGLPNKIRIKLREASSFLFVGFDFEKWYSQLILQLLTYERKGRPKFSLTPSKIDHSSRNFLVRQFQVHFLDSEASFFEELYDALDNKNLLRNLTLPNKEEEAASVEVIRSLIADGKVDQALKIAKNLNLNNEELNEYLLLLSRYNKWRDNNNHGVYLPGESTTILNQIIKDFLNFLNGLK